MQLLHQIALISGLLCALPVAAVAEPEPMQEDSQQVRGWNRFFDELVKTHHWYEQNRSLRRVSTTGGYAAHPDYYREVSYYDKQTGRLLSRIRWVKDKPDEIHMIEIFVYDDNGRIKRDYLAAYLPDFRNAPVQTLINFHHYNDELHAYRQFDASGALIYEQCRGRYFNEPVFLSIEEDEIPDYRDEAYPEYETYLACFEMLPQQAGQFLAPYQAELQRRTGSAQASAAESAAEEDIDETLASLTRHIARQPANIKWYLARGDAWFKQHEFDKAVADFTQALALDKESSQAWFGRGMAYGRMGRIDEGIADLSEFIRRNPDSSLGYTKRGVRYLWKGDRENAEKDLQRAVQLDPKNAEAHDDLGVIYAQRGELDQAIRHFTVTISVDPGYLKGYHNLAMAHHLAGEQHKALIRVNQALALKGDERVTLLLKSRILAAQGKRHQAASVQDKAEFLPEGNWSELAPDH